MHNLGAQDKVHRVSWRTVYKRAAARKRVKFVDFFARKAKWLYYF